MKKKEWKFLLEGWNSFIKESNLIHESVGESLVFFDKNIDEIKKEGITADFFESLYSHIRDNYFPDDIVEDIKMHGKLSKYYYRNLTADKRTENLLKKHYMPFAFKADRRFDRIFSFVYSSDLSDDAKVKLANVLGRSGDYPNETIIINPKGININQNNFGSEYENYSILILRTSLGLFLSLPEIEFADLSEDMNLEQLKNDKVKNDRLRYNIAQHYIKNLEEWKKQRKTFYEFSMIDTLYDEGDARVYSLEQHKKRLGYSSLTDHHFKKIIEDIDIYYFDKESVTNLISQGKSIEEVSEDVVKESNIEKYEKAVVFYREENPKKWEEEGRDLFYYLSSEKPVDIIRNSTSNSVDLPRFILRERGYEVFNKQDYINLIIEIDGDFDPDYQLDPNFKCHNSTAAFWYDVER